MTHAGRKDIIIQEIHALCQRGYELHFRATGSSLRMELTHVDDVVASVVKLYDHGLIVTAPDMLQLVDHDLAVMAAELETGQPKT